MSGFEEFVPARGCGPWRLFQNTLSGSCGEAGWPEHGQPLRLAVYEDNLLAPEIGGAGI